MITGRMEERVGIKVGVWVGARVEVGVKVGVWVRKTKFIKLFFFLNIKTSSKLLYDYKMYIQRTLGKERQNDYMMISNTS